MYISSVQSLSHVRLFVTPWIAAHQASLSITNSRSSLRLMSIESVMPSSHLILCRPLLLLPPTPPSIRVFSNQSTLRMRWPKYWSFSFSIIHYTSIKKNNNKNGCDVSRAQLCNNWCISGWADTDSHWSENSAARRSQFPHSSPRFSLIFSHKVRHRTQQC